MRKCVIIRRVKLLLISLLSISQDQVNMKFFIFTCLLAVALAKHVSIIRYR